MGKYVFLFDLDSTITRQEILPTISKSIGIHEEMSKVTDMTMRGEIPFTESFLRRVDLLKHIPINEVSELIGRIELNNLLVDFIQKNKSKCFVVTGNLDVWIEKLLERMGIKENTYCSRALIKNGHIEKVFSVLDKGMFVRQLQVPFVAVGDGNNDADMIAAADVGIGYGGVRNIAKSVYESADYNFYDESALVEFLWRLEE